MISNEYAYFKRCLDCYSGDPDYRKLMDSNPEEAIKVVIDGAELQVSLDSHYVYKGIQTILYEGATYDNAGDNPYLLAYLKHYAPIIERTKENLGENRYRSIQIAYFQEITRNRCQTERALFKKYSNIHYYPICFELSYGCKQQCDFCGLNAPIYEDSFLYTKENSKLFGEIIEITRDFLGDVVDSCPLYFATEPLDNPDYEKFLAEFNKIFDKCPQTTTVLADKYPNRIRNIIKLLGEDGVEKNAGLRLSTRSLSEFKNLMKEYSPRELEFIEVLANHRESVHNLSDSGRRRRPSKDNKENLDYSISCISGLRVNLVKKTIQFIEPEVPSDLYPEGISIKEEHVFADSLEYKKLLKLLFDKYAKGELPSDRSLYWNKNINIEIQDGLINFLGEENIFRCNDTYTMRNLINSVKINLSFEQIAAKLGLFMEQYSEYYNIFNDLYIRGYLRFI